MILTLTIRSGATPRVSLQMYSNASVNSASPARMATSSPYTWTSSTVRIHPAFMPSYFGDLFGSRIMGAVEGHLM